jgi:predicted dehydrogenase
MAIQAIQRGIHTMIEKPVGIFPEELNALTECLHAHPEVKAGVLYCRRTNPIFLQIKDFLDSGALGQLKRVTWIITNASVYRTQAYYNTATWRGTYLGEGGGLLLNQVSHHIDMLVWLLGLPEAIQANCYTARERNIEVENEVSVTMEYPGQAIGQFISSTREFPGTNRLEISGSKAQLILENEKDLTVRKLGVEETEFNKTTNIPYAFIPYEEEVKHFDPYQNPEIQARIVNNFLSAIADGTPIACPVEDAIRSQQFIQATYLSSWQNKKLALPTDDAAYTEELKKRQ